MTTSILEAYDLIAQARDLARRLDAAAAALAKRPGLKEEKAWLESGRVRLERAREGIDDLLDRALRLQELESKRGGRGRELQGEVVDAIERLQAGIAFAGGARSPLLEVLFSNAKFPLMRKLDPQGFERAWRDFEKRLGSSYVKRMLADETYSVVAPTVEEVRQAYLAWRKAFDPTPLTEAEIAALHEELLTTAQRVDLPTRQARLLAQAALLPTKDILDEQGLTPKPKRRGAADPDTHPLLEENPPEPPHPKAPTPEELAELEAYRAEASAEEEAEKSRKKKAADDEPPKEEPPADASRAADEEPAGAAAADEAAPPSSGVDERAAEKPAARARATKRRAKG